MSIYEDMILDHYNFPRNHTKLQNPSAKIHVDNPLCGDSLDMEIEEKGGRIKEVGFTGQGCAISIASASLLTEHVKGKTKDEVLKIDKDNVVGLLNIELSPNRLKCALLAWEGIRKLVNS
ncbi:MAG TPA: SUF system NifU family Fe-S cluster assembly protein [Candidatus Woesebacteria bacterium]|nr:SUF system NifU family Fe-S cluster assembly protein [Candidatus Woesebacteria bacterium]